MRGRMVSALAVAGLATVLVAGGCGAGGDSEDSAAVAPAQQAGQEDAAVGNQGAGTGPEKRAPAGTDLAAEPGRAADPAKPAGGQPDADVRAPNLAIIYTGSMTVRVEDVGTAAGRATSIATGVGGFVGADRRSDDGASSRATLELRVPAERFNRVVDELAGLGRTERREVGSQDVTEEVIDLDARIATQRARVASGRRLLAQAKTLADLVSLESELAKREADLASLEAKKRRLADLTALSTVTVELLGPDATAPAKPKEEASFLAGLSGGWTALLAVLQVALMVLGALLPFALVLGVPAYLALRLTRRHRRRVVGTGGGGSTPPVPAARTALADTEPAHTP